VKPMKPLLVFVLAPVLIGGVLAVAAVVLSSRISEREEASPYWIERQGDGQRLLERIREAGLP
jgi:Flp pilus assembly protein protease CpaA